MPRGGNRRSGGGPTGASGLGVQVCGGRGVARGAGVWLQALEGGGVYGATGGTPRGARDRDGGMTDGAGVTGAPGALGTAAAVGGGEGGVGTGSCADASRAAAASAARMIERGIALPQLGAVSE